MEKANKANAYAAVILGSDEIQKGVATVKNLDTGAQTQIALNNLKEAL